MENNFYDRFREELLIRKEVSILPDIFQKYYNIFFPDSKEFILLLQPQMQEEAISSAKKIFDRLQFSLTCPIPQVYSDNLLNVESSTNDLAGKFVAQDHYVHSVYLYLVGIYIFFNHKVIHEHIMSQIDLGKKQIKNPFSDPCCEKVKLFIRAWTYFALYHDLGYAFEKPLTGDKNKMIVNKRVKLPDDFFNAYNEIEEYLSYELALKFFSRYLLYWIVISKSKKTLAEALYLEDELQWKSLQTPFSNALPCSSQSITEKLKEYQGFVCLANVNTYSNLLEIVSLINSEKLLVVAYTKRGNIFAIKTPEEIYYCDDIYTLKQRELRELEFIGSEEDEEDKCYCEYYVDKTQAHDDELQKKISIYSYMPHFGDIIKTVFEEKSTLFTCFTSKSNLCSIRYDLYRYLKDKYPIQDLGKELEKKIKEQHSSKLKDAIKGEIYEKVEGYLKESESILLDESILDSAIQTLRSRLEEINANGIKDKLKSKEIDLIAQDTLFNCIKNIKTNLKAGMKLKIPMISYFSEEDQLYMQVHPLNIRQVKKKRKGNYSNSKKFIVKLEKTLNISLVELGFLKEGQTIDDFLTYQSPHTAVDHGIISASILANCLMAYQLLAEIKPQETFVTLNTPGITLPIYNRVNEEIELVWKKAFFAILVHNIYGDTYNRQTENRYMHRLDINAFAYLGAFADSLQFWNRNRQYNPATHKPVPVYYAGNVDIEIEEQKIRITCTAEDIDAANQDRKKNLREYMQDASQLISLNIIETEPRN